MKMRKEMRIRVLVLILTAAFLYSCQLSGPPAEEEASGEGSYGAAQVKVYEVKKMKVSEKLYYTGLIEAWKEISISPDVGGKIASIHVEEGDRVREGQLLAEMDTRAIRLQLDQARAGLAVAEANYKDAQRNKERMERLNEENAVSEQQYEKIMLAYEAAEAQLQQATAALNLAEHQLEVSLMKAPFSGVIAAKNGEVGDMINPMMGGPGVLTLVDFYKVKIAIDVSQRDIIRIKKGQPVLLSVSVFPDKTFQGSVSVVNLVADPMSKKFSVEVAVENPDLILRPNTFGEVIFEVETHENALAIPQRAVLENRYVFVAKDSTAERREVVLGLQNTETIEVVSGISEGELVIVDGNYGLENGAEIEILEVIQ
jgi:RND family efflux transporter MFP subunit